MTETIVLSPHDSEMYQLYQTSRQASRVMSRWVAIPSTAFLLFVRYWLLPMFSVEFEAALSQEEIMYSALGVYFLLVYVISLLRGMSLFLVTHGLLKNDSTHFKTELKRMRVVSALYSVVFIIIGFGIVKFLNMQVLEAWEVTTGFAFIALVVHIIIFGFVSMVMPFSRTEIDETDLLRSSACNMM